MTFHVVCHDCTRWEGVYDDEEVAQAIVEAHSETEHNVEYARVC